MGKNKKTYEDKDIRIHKIKKRVSTFDKHKGLLRDLANVSASASVEEDFDEDLDYEMFEKIKR